jgi:hypothetical protein
MTIFLIKNKVVFFISIFLFMTVTSSTNLNAEDLELKKVSGTAKVVKTFIETRNVYDQSIVRLIS